MTKDDREAEFSAHALVEPKQMAYEVNRRKFLAETNGTIVRRSKHNKIKTESFDA